MNHDRPSSPAVVQTGDVESETSSKEGVLVPSPSSELSSPPFPSKPDETHCDRVETVESGEVLKQPESESMCKDDCHDIIISQPCQADPYLDVEESNVLLTSVKDNSRDWHSSTAGLQNYSWNLFLDGGGDGLASIESDEDPSLEYSPPAARWAVSLRDLLNDKEGCDLFELFLNDDNMSKQSAKMLKFWYACSGLRKATTRTTEDTRELINLIWNKFINNNSVKVSEETKMAIKSLIDQNCTDTSVFDEAQLEVESQMNETVYPRFLSSNLYISYYFGNGKEAFDQLPHSIASEGLPTLHEDSEYDHHPMHSKSRPSFRPKFSHKLTSDNLLATAKYRARSDKMKAEQYAGIYLKEDSFYGRSPYHCGGYISGHAVSLQDSELHSLSSDAHTDDTRSFTDSSLDGIPLTSKYMRKHQRFLKYKEEEGVRHNVDESIDIPRVMKYHQPCVPIATANPEEFFKLISAKLEKVIEDSKKNERIQCTMRKLIHSEDDPTEVRREHAVNSLPPNVLVNKLQEKVLDEMDQCLSDQSILDNHIKKWDPSTCSPSSPKYGMHSPPTRGLRGPCNRQLPHLNLPLTQNVSAYNPKYIAKGLKHHFLPSSYSSVPQSIIGHPLASKGCFSISQIPTGPCSYQLRTSIYGREKERDVYSTFSSDSGNVADYHESSERLASSQLPKSKSVPDCMENNNAMGVCEGGRRQGQGTRRSCRRLAAELTDSGVSVISDSGRSVAHSTVSSERVENWLLQSRPFSTGIPLHSHAPLSEKDFPENSKVRGSRSSSHTIAGFSSPVALRGTDGVEGRRSQSSSGTSAVTCISAKGKEVPASVQYLEISRDSPLGQSQQYILHEKRKTRGNGSSSSKSTGHGSSFGEGNGSSGSSLKRQQRVAKCDVLPSSTTSSILTTHSTTISTIGGPSTCCAPPSLSTTIIYNFSDDEVPFMIKLQTRPVTLRKYKENLPKKGNFRFFFKKVCEEIGVVFEELTDEAEPLPLFEDKVFSLVRRDDAREEV